ncbi:single-stranded-DNA-specific exonuclease RecJ [bacterium]|nr:single-stranded-DNA-specific exonuclease RecJ [bacterium]
MSKQWKLLEKISEETVSQFPDLNKIILQLLHNRNIKTQAEIDEFFNSDYSDDIHDPYLLQDMKKAVKRIYQAVEKKEEVLVYGDYDADGVTSSALLYDILYALGLRIDVYIPHRETEGYGFNMNSVQTIIDKKYTLVITCDCGISNFDEIKKLKKAGIDVIITDHHQEPQKLPPALAIIHAGLSREKYPFDKLAGVGIAYKLATGLLKSDLCKLEQDEKNKTAKWLLDLVALGTVADMVPLRGENRTLVKYGLIVLQKTKRLGLQKLYEISGTRVDRMSSYTIGFQIGPRLNAAGRMDHANTAFELLKTKNIDTALRIANELNQNNSQRQNLTKKMVSEAKNQIECVDDDLKSIWVSKDDWNLGIVGLVAGKLSNEYYRPSFVFGFDGQKWSGSCRGIDELDLMEIITKVSDKLVKFGGHKSAAGFSMLPENFSKVRENIKEEIKKKLKGIKLKPSLYLDVEIKLVDINWDLWDLLDKFEPYGMENSKPKFLIKDCLVKSYQYLGKDKSHLKIEIEQEGVIKKAIFFSGVSKFSNLKTNDKIDLVTEIGVNEWNGNRTLELYIVDLKIK